MDKIKRNKKHLVGNRHFIQAQEYKFRSRPIPKNPPPAQDRHVHGPKLQQQLQEIKQAVKDPLEKQQECKILTPGFQLEFVSFPEVKLALDQLVREGVGIELMNCRIIGEEELATVFIPDGKLDVFESKIAAYTECRTTPSGKIRDNHNLVERIKDIRLATVRALWTDSEDSYPCSIEEKLWLEIWMPLQTNEEEIRTTAAALGIKLGEHTLRFPERIVFLAHCSIQDLSDGITILNRIAELRKAKETADFFDELPLSDQQEWLGSLVSRCNFLATEESPHICIIDTGINNGHPILIDSLDDQDLHSIDEITIGLDDQNGHGTAMAGLAMLGDLTGPTANTDVFSLTHRLESVKILNHNGANGLDPLHHGYLTQQAVARPEIQAPHRKRVYCLAITASDNRDLGYPSAWSATIDGLAINTLDETARLILVAAGNINSPLLWNGYPESNTCEGIHDPSQAWNAITIGGFTNLTQLEDDARETYKVKAQVGDLSPFSTTSACWLGHHPVKPDVVFEAGNVANDGLGCVTTQSLSLLTLSHRPTERLFTTFRATSASTAIAAKFAAELMANYPDLRMESVRGLMVHAARWTPAMKARYLTSPHPRKADYMNLLRHCGFGEPKIDLALWSAGNSVCLIFEDELQPFSSQSGKVKLNEMKVFSLPWPKDQLEALGTAKVELRVTLSYYIEPNPSRRGQRSRYHYESHGLRFDVKRPLESDGAFHNRISASANQGDDGDEATDTRADNGWLIGTNARHRGSIHSDVWEGTAVDLASRGKVSVYPTRGWWKTRPKLERFDKPARFSLIISIEVPEVEVDLYSVIENQLELPIEIES